MEKEIDKELVGSFLENAKEITLIEGKISVAIVEFQKELEEKSKKQSEIKEAIKVAMKEQGVKKFEDEVISLTYVASTTRKTIDTEKLKEEKPELWEEYSKESPVSDSIRIKIK